MNPSTAARECLEERRISLPRLIGLAFKNQSNLNSTPFQPERNQAVDGETRVVAVARAQEAGNG